MARKQSSAPGPVVFVTDSSDPSLVQAAALALEIMRHAKVARWADLPDDIFVDNPAPGVKVRLDQTQVDMLAEHFQVVSLLTPPVTVAGVRSKPVTLAVCEDCGRWMLAAASAAFPKRCLMTVDCRGVYLKVTRPEIQTPEVES